MRPSAVFRPTATPEPGPWQPSPMRVPNAETMKPLSTTMMLSDKVGFVGGRELDPPARGGCESIIVVKVTVIVARTNISTFVMMSRNGTMFSSPPSSSGASSRGIDRRRTLLRCAALSFSLSAIARLPAALVASGAGLDGQEIEHALLRRVEVVLDVLRALMQKEVRDHARDRDPEAERRVVHGLRDAERELRLTLRSREARVGHGVERQDEARDRSEEADERRDVRERPERPDPLL